MVDFSSEKDLVKAFVDEVTAHKYLNQQWTIYPETAGWDLVLVHKSGMQLGIEAKLSLNAKVIDQALSNQHTKWNDDGPDWRAVLVPEGKCQLHLTRICAAIGVRIITSRKAQRGVIHHIYLPEPDKSYCDWPTWCPSQRLTLPDYIPDVTAGVSSPVALTEWKINAIKLLIVLDRQGFVTRSDMKALGISPTRWTDAYQGYLERSQGRFIRSKRTPDLRQQHPVNYAEIEADIGTWGKFLDPFKQTCPDWLIAGVCKDKAP